MEENEFLYKGWLFKRSRFMKKWRRRYTVITKTQLMTFDSENINEAPTEILYIKYCNGVKSAEEETNKENSLCIDYQGTLFYFYADSAEEKTKWIGIISKSIITPSIKQIKQYESDSSDDD